MFFFFNDTATTEIYTLSLHDALPIYPFSEQLRALFRVGLACRFDGSAACRHALDQTLPGAGDRKSTRLNSSHLVISYAVFCLKKKNVLQHGRSAEHCAQKPHSSRTLS